MNSGSRVLLDFYLDVSDMNDEEVNTYLNNIGKDPVLLKTNALAFVNKLIAKQKIKKGKAYVETAMHLITKIKDGVKLPNMEKGLQKDILFQFNKLKNLNEQDIFDLMEDKTKLDIMKYIKENWEEK